MVWISTVVAMIDGRLLRAAGCLLVAAALALFGLIHSVDPRGGLYLPWELQGLPEVEMGQFVGAYVALAAVLALLSLPKQTSVRATPPTPPGPHEQDPAQPRRA